MKTTPCISLKTDDITFPVVEQFAPSLECGLYWVDCDFVWHVVVNTCFVNSGKLSHILRLCLDMFIVVKKRSFKCVSDQPLPNVASIILKAFSCTVVHVYVVTQSTDVHNVRKLAFS